MEKSYHMYEDIAPVMANYSRAVRAGDFFFITGTTAGGSDAAQGDMAAQLRVKRWTAFGASLSARACPLPTW